VNERELLGDRLVGFFVSINIEVDLGCERKRIIGMKWLKRIRIITQKGICR
jgi:hypothetical protein